MRISCWLAMMLTVACFNILGCGENTNNVSVIDSSSKVSSFRSFDFTATVDNISGSPPYNVAIGDKLQGKIVYQLDANDWNVSDINQGWFHHMASPARIEFKLNTLEYASTGANYYILIENDDASVLPVRDNFEIFSSSDDDAKLNTIFYLRDFTATAFSNSTCNSLPQSLNLTDFSNNQMFINYNNSVAPWGISLVPYSITKSL